MARIDFQSAPSEMLASGLDCLGLDIAPAQRSDLLAFLDLLKKWNGAYNLTAVRDLREMVVRHVFDSLSAGAYLGTGKVLDVGTGAGVPGIPLAICYPENQFVLLDSNGKKHAFLRALLRQLKLSNVELLQTRAEALTSDRRYDCLICRAFSSPGTFVDLARGLLVSGGRAIYMAGKVDAAVPEQAGFSHPELIKLEVPGLDAERHLLIYERQALTGVELQQA